MSLTKTARLLLLAANIWYFGEGMMGPLFAIFAERIGGDILDITWAWATYLIITGMVYILVGRFLDMKSHTSTYFKEKTMVVGYAFNAVCTFGYIFVNSPFELLAVQAGLGIAEAIGTPAWDSLYARSIAPQMDSYAWGLSTGQSQIVSGVAFAIGGVITHFVSFEALFVTMGIIQVIAAVVASRLLYLDRNDKT